MTHTLASEPWLRAAEGRTLILMAPGWVRTELGGPEGRLSIEESVPNVVSTLLAARGRPGFDTSIISARPAA